MKAAIYQSYGPPEVVEIAEVPKPIPKDDEVLIKIQAASVNPYDWHFMRGLPYIVRIVGGFPKPKDNRLGADVAGQVEAAGKSVTQFKINDEVFGTCKGAFAEYACAPENRLALKPQNLTVEQAAAVPIAGFTALQGLRKKVKIRQGQKVLVNGAAGGVGTFAVQIARSMGAEVTGVCSTRNVEMVRSIGAAHVIDYSKEDFTKGERRYDVILDAVGNHSLSKLRGVLNAKSTYVAVGGPSDPWMIQPLARTLMKVVLSLFGGPKMFMIFASFNQDDLKTLQELMQSGKVTPVVDRSYKLQEIREAIRYVETGHARGKVVVTMN